MRYCSVPQCYSSASDNVSMHYFPHNPIMQEQWRRVLRIGKHITKYMNVCGLHFTKDNFFFADVDARKRFLKKGSIPSQNLPKGQANRKLINPQKQSKDALAKQESPSAPESVISTSIVENLVVAEEVEIESNDAFKFSPPKKIDKISSINKSTNIANCLKKSKSFEKKKLTKTSNALLKYKHCENVVREEDLIAQSWTYKLNRMKNDQRIWAEKFINDILTEGELNTLNRRSVSINKNTISESLSTTIRDNSVKEDESNNKR